VYVEGLLHVTELGNDYFHYDKARHEMAGERTGVRYRLGDRLTVKLVRVDLETTKIDFTLSNKNNKLEGENKVDYKELSSPYKASGKSQTAVKSTPDFRAPKSETAFGKKPADRSSKRSSGGSAAPKSKSSKSQKVMKKATKRKVKK
jgi:ribonuclease R